MSKIKNPTIFQKSTISIVIISAVTAGLIALEQSINKNNLFSTQQIISQQNTKHEKPHTTTITGADNSEIALVFDVAPVVETLDITQPVKQPVTQTTMQAIQIEQPVELVDHNITDTALEDTSIKDTSIKEKVLFDFSSSEIGPEYYQSLLEMAQLINNSDVDNQTLWQVVGYADLTGNHQFNIELAKRRAQAVATFLVDKGVDEAQLSIVSLGDTSPIQAGQKRGANKLDRRVEVHSYQAEITALAEQLSIKNKQKTKDLVVTAEQLIEKTDIEIKPAMKSFTQEKSGVTELTEQQLPATSNLLTSSTKMDF
jgi:outer membrane protein OmpA-like peptidoglycan-associated protein